MTDVVVCPSNLGPKETRKRLVGGVVFTLLALVASGVALVVPWGVWGRVAILPVAYLGLLSLLQARKKT